MEEEKDMLTGIREIVAKAADLNGEISKSLPALGFPKDGKEFVETRRKVWELLAGFVEEMKKLNQIGE